MKPKLIPTKPPDVNTILTGEGIRSKRKAKAKRCHGSHSNSGRHLVLCSNYEGSRERLVGLQHLILEMEQRGVFPTGITDFLIIPTHHLHLWP